MNLLTGALASGAFLFILFVPAWWLARYLQDEDTTPFFRALLAIGLAFVGYLSFVNLLGRLTGHSIVPVMIYLVLNAVAIAALGYRRPQKMSLSPLLTTWRSWIGPVVLAMVMGVPQWFVAVSTPYWDEVASSAIHLTAPNQFAEDVFPPRHNALPDISIKYHYASTMLAGTVRWLTSLSANVSIDVTSTALWLFSFLFVYFWFRELAFDGLVAAWASFAMLIGGGLGWLYLQRTETYDGIEKLPPPTALVHRFDPATSWFENLVAVGRVPSAHLRNTDGSLSHLPWDIAAEFEQHAVALGIAITLVALYVFVRWQKRTDLHVPILAANIVTFGLLFLAHAVFGLVGAMTAGLCTLIWWLRQPTRTGFFQGVAFAVGLSILALLHGGLLATGAHYGSSSDAMTVRSGFGYFAGGLRGFVDWNVAGFGLPLLFALVAWITYRRRREPAAADRGLVFTALTIFAAFSYFVPQLVFYSSAGTGVEQFTEVAKFFFSAHLGFALLSAFGVAALRRYLHWAAVTPLFAAMAITPLAFCYANSVNKSGTWLGFYHAPYFRNSTEQQMGETLAALKTGNKDVYFDASADERIHGFLSEMLVFGGSVFTLTPSRYEQTGIGYRLSEDVVAQRYAQNARLWRLLPGAAEECGCRWYYARPAEDLALAPMIMRSRFDKLVAERYLERRLRSGRRVLYSFEKATADLDQNIEQYWRPRVVSQARTDWDGDGKSDVIFYDYVDKRIVSGTDAVDLPGSLRDEFVPLYVGTPHGHKRVDFFAARLKDTTFHWGKKLADLVEQNRWAWTNRHSDAGTWQPEYDEWLWDWDIPLMTRLDSGDGDALVAYRARTGQWLKVGSQTLAGPTPANLKEPVLPVGGRFLQGSAGDLGLWSLGTNTLTLQTIATGRKVSFTWGGPGDVLVPGDYTGEGYDSVAVWRRANQTWSWRRAPDGSTTDARFGTETSVPLPADYNHDRRLDLAYWEPAAGKIFVSFSNGRSIDLVVPVPPHTIPAFVNMY